MSLATAASMPESPADAELVARVARGDLEALGALFERYEPSIRSYLVRLGVVQGDVDDLVQGTFLEVVRAAERYDADHPVKTWLLGIATMMVRRHRRSAARLAARLVAWSGLAEHAAPSAQATPSELIEHDEAARRLSAALNRLAPAKRAAFVLVTLEGLSGEAAARVLGVPVKTVWTRLHYARRELRAALGGRS